MRIHTRKGQKHTGDGAFGEKVVEITGCYGFKNKLYRSISYTQKGARIIEIQLDKFAHTEHACVTRTRTKPQAGI